VADLADTTAIGRGERDLNVESRPFSVRSSAPALSQIGASKSARADYPILAGLPEPDEIYRTTVAFHFRQRNFNRLEEEAQTARSGKGPFPCGSWRLFEFYGAVESVPKKNWDDNAWDEHLRILQEWVAAKPESATARIALANAHIGLGWRASGRSYANTVTAEGWETFGRELELARTTLVEAAKLQQRCPYWFEATQDVALAQGWEKNPARELFDQAIAFEPTYYHYYRAYANYLLLK
jgi:hypothetical protein